MLQCGKIITGKKDIKGVNMSQVKRRSFIVLFLVTVLSIFMVGCKDKTVAVKDISFNLTEGEQIVLLVGQTLDLADYVEIKPENATNKNYSISSFNEEVVHINGTQIQALSEGSTQIKLVAEDNNVKQDLMSVVVKQNKTTLSAPKNLTYDSSTQTFKFDIVPNATSYTIKINGKEVELGNSNVCDLNKLDIQIFNTLVFAQVKANAPSYSYALEDSTFSEELKIYQAAKVENVKIDKGVLSFEKSDAKLRSNIYIDDTLYIANQNDVLVDLNRLPEIYAGKNVEIKIEAVVSQDIKTELGENVVYCNSELNVLDLRVLDIPKLKVKTTTIEWQNIAECNGYEIYVDNQKIASTQNNVFDLRTWNGFDSTILPNKIATVLVKPVVAKDDAFVGRTDVDGNIQISRLSALELICYGPDIVWQEVENASAYSFVLMGEGVAHESSTADLFLSMKGYSAGEYNLTAQAIASEFADEEGVYYVSSSVSTIEFSKQPMVSANISNYVLRIDELKTDTAKIVFDKAEHNKTVVGSGALKTVDLSTLAFDAGENTIKITRLGNNLDVVDSSEFELKFVQFEAINSIAINDAKANVQRSVINKNAEIRLETIDKTSQTLKFVKIGENVTYNTTSTTQENYLKAGSYQTNVYVVGNGSTTFSHRNGEGKLVASASVDFDVLQIPNLVLNDTAIEKLTITNTQNALNFDIYKVEGESKTLVSNVEIPEFDFEQAFGSVKYAVQAKGDGSRYLNSIISSDVTITRIITPTLSYDSNTEILSKHDENVAATVKKHILTKDGAEDSYDFASKYSLTQDTIFTLQAIAQAGINNNYYLNSDVHTLELKKIPCACTVELDLNNNLVITPESHEDEYDLEVLFNFSTKAFKTSGDKITDGDDELPYVYENGKYIISLIDENYNARIADFNNEFSVQVKFNKPNTLNKNLINSEYTTQTTLEIVRIDADVEMSINSSNEIEIVSASHREEYALILIVDLGSELIFISDGQGKLVCDEIVLPYTFEKTGENEGCYKVKLLNDDYSSRIEALISSFKVKVQFRALHNDVVSDLDSGFSATSNFSVLEKATISREKQNLKIAHAKAGYSFENYALIVNTETKPLFLTQDVVSIDDSDNTILVDIDYVFDNYSLKAEDINNINVITLNYKDENATKVLSRKSEPIYVKKANSVPLSITKVNDNTDDGKFSNSAVAWFEVEETVFDKSYFIEICKGDEVKAIQEFDEFVDAESGIVSLKLDDALDKIPDVEGQLILKAGIKTNDNYVDENSRTIEVFNSNKNMVVELEKITTAKNLKVSDGVLTFDAVTNAVGYEIYQYSATTPIKLYSGIISDNKHSLVDLYGEMKLCVRAISKENGYTNSSYSEIITISKLNSPKVSIVDGKFALDVTDIADLVLSGVEITPVISNAQSEAVSIDVNNLGEEIKLIVTLTNVTTSEKMMIELTDWNVASNTEVISAMLSGFTKVEKVELIAEPYLFMTYNSASLKAEDLSIKLKVEYDGAEGFYYFNSDELEMSVYGLFEAVNVKKRQSEDNSVVETIEWTPNSKNTLSGNNLNNKYVVKIVHTVGENSTTYYSTDKDLIYFDTKSGEYKSYGTITSNSIVFPAGYKLKEIIEEGKPTRYEPEVMFNIGSFEVSVQTIPTTVIDQLNVCSSKFSSACKFEFLDKLDLTVEEGYVVWETTNKAQRYYVTISDGTEEKYEIVNSNQYDLDNMDWKQRYGVFSVKVKAISTASDILNSAESDEIYIYHLPEAESASIDDGKLVLLATPFFSFAEIEFVDQDGKTYYDTYDNTEVATKKLKDLALNYSLDTWKDFSDYEEINDPMSIVVEINKDLMSVLDGNNYIVNVRLIGNSSSDLGLVSSSKVSTLSKLTAKKLKPSVSEVELGVMEFSADDDYATIDENNMFSVDSTIDLNYRLNGVDASQFWENTILYKLELTHSKGVTSIYAVDYYSFITAVNNGTISTSEYALTTARQNGHYAVVYYPYAADEKIYFNVYYENKINLRDYDYLDYYPVKEYVKDGANWFESEKDASTGLVEKLKINLVEGGSFTFRLFMIGGDSVVDGETSTGYLSSSANDVKTFVRYSTNVLSTHNGLIQFNNLIPYDDEGNFVDLPVYRIVAEALLNDSGATPITKVFYVFNPLSEGSGLEDVVKEIAKRHELSLGLEEGSHLNAIYDHFEALDGCDIAQVSPINENLFIYSCNCNIFKSYTTHDLDSHGNMRYSFIGAFDDISKSLEEFLTNYSIDGNVNEWTLGVDDENYSDYSELFDKFKNLSDKSYVAIGNCNDIAKSAIVGIDKPFVITAGSTLSYEEALSTVSILLGFKETETFISEAQNVANLLLQNSKGVSPDMIDRLKYAGTIYTENGSFILPFMFKNSLDETVLSYVNIDENGMISVWVDDIDKAFRFAGLDGDESSESIMTYARCSLFDELAIGFDITKHLDANVAQIYKVSIRTLAGIGSLQDEYNYLLNAKLPTETTSFYKLSDTTFSVSNGDLKFNQSFIMRDNARVYCDLYEISLIDVDEGEEFIYEINRTSDGVKFDDVNKVITYSLPSQIKNKSNKTFVVSEGKEYKIKIRALAEDDYVLNGTFAKNGTEDVTLTFRRSSGISTEVGKGLRVEDGVLKWNLVEPNLKANTVLKIEFADESGSKYIYIDVSHESKKFDENGNYLYHFFEFGDVKYALSTMGSSYITEGVEYTVSAYVKGVSTVDENVIHSSYTPDTTITRLGQVSNNIKTENGYLTWEAVDGALSYNVYVYGLGSKVIENVQTNMLDLSGYGLVAGQEYSILVRANGQDVLNGMKSVAVGGFVPLNSVDDTQIKIVNGKIVWNAVDGAEAYEVDLFYTNSMNEEKEILDDICTDIVNGKVYYEVDVEDGVKGKFVVSISAIGLNEGKWIKSAPIAFEASQETPQAATRVWVDEQTQKIKIEVSDDFSQTDTLRLRFNREDYTVDKQQANGTDAIQYYVDINFKQEEYYDYETNCYQYQLNIMAVYTNVSVVVLRSDALYSPAIKIGEDDWYYDLHLFSYGSGEFDDKLTPNVDESNPYRISSAEQLLNIKYFTSANYVLTQSIDMSNINVQETMTQNGALICDEFSGCIDGTNNKLSIILPENIELNDAKQFALFGTMKYATMKNLTFKSENSDLILSNTFAFDVPDVVKLSLIATGANNSTLENIEVVNFKISLNGNEVGKKELNLSGLINEMNNTTINNLKMDFTAEIDVTLSGETTTYVAGVAKYAINSNILNSYDKNNEISFKVVTQTTNSITYVGGVVAEFTADSKDYGIMNTTVDVDLTNVKVLYFGGLVGFARYITISESKTTGLYSQKGIDYSTYIGGLVGYAQALTIENSGSHVVIDVTTNNSNNKYFGKIVGFAEKHDGVSSLIKNCYSDDFSEEQMQTTIVKNGNIYSVTIGMVGKSDFRPTGSIRK